MRSSRRRGSRELAAARRSHGGSPPKKLGEFTAGPAELLEEPRKERSHSLLAETAEFSQTSLAVSFGSSSKNLPMDPGEFGFSVCSIARSLSPARHKMSKRGRHDDEALAERLAVFGLNSPAFRAREVVFTAVEEAAEEGSFKSFKSDSSSASPEAMRQHGGGFATHSVLTLAGVTAGEGGSGTSSRDGSFVRDGSCSRETPMSDAVTATPSSTPWFQQRMPPSGMPLTLHPTPDVEGVTSKFAAQSSQKQRASFMSGLSALSARSAPRR